MQSVTEDFGFKNKDCGFKNRGFGLEKQSLCFFNLFTDYTINQERYTVIPSNSVFGSVNTL